MPPRRRAALLTATGLAALALAAGCGNPDGTDGDLADDWPALAEPAGFTPEAGVCHLAAYAGSATRDAYEEADCALRHRTETVHVGAYDGPAAAADAPPEADSAAGRAAYRTCDEKTTAYVGGAWRTARLWIGVTAPTAAGWRGGSRWYRCEVLEIGSVEDDGGPVLRTGSLRDALRSPSSPLRLTCYAVTTGKSGAIDTMPKASCSAKHNAEFVGVWDAGDLPYPEKDATWRKFHDGCRGLIARYAGVPDDGDLPYRTGVVSLPGGADVWDQGDHRVRCYLWLDGAALTAPLRGAGPAELPVQYDG